MREQVGHWEADTVIGAGSKDCVLTLVERKSELVLVGKFKDRTAGGLRGSSAAPAASRR